MPGGRPGLPPGTYGEIAVSHVGPSKYKARARYRERAGTVRLVARFGQSETDAKNRLRAALADWQATGGQGVSRSTTITALGRQWLDEIEQSSRATNTKETYRYAVERYVGPYLGAIRLGEVTTGIVDSALARVRLEKGPSAAKTTRAVLNGMFGLAVRHDALEVNPVRETSSIPTARKLSRALTPAEVEDITDRFRSDDRAMMLDVPDLVDFGLATACRIGEALAIRESVLDLDAGTVEINATAIRVKGVGMVIQERPKSAAGWRVLRLPSYAVEMLQRRRGEIRFNPPVVKVMDPDGVIREEAVWVAFPAPMARSLRDPSNTAGDLRDALDRFGYPWVSFHTFRKTVLTRLDEAGLTAREIADYAGHSQPSMTQDRYMGRRVVSERAATVLDR